jgi:glycosyltransferase involved in cell wall biosynthesis
MSEADGLPALPGRVLVYYFAFPRYRLEILHGLEKEMPERVELASGSTSRASIVALDESDISSLSVKASLHVGPVSWDRGVLVPASGRRFDSVVLGPATMSLTTWAILVCRRVRGRKTFLWGQCGKFGDRSLKRRVQEAMNRLATGLLVYGENEAIAATQMGLPRDRVHVVHNATRSNTASAKSRGEVRVLFVGRVNKDKRLAVLLEAAEMLRASEYPCLTVDIIGDGDDREAMRAAYPESWARFHGWVYESATLKTFFEEATFVCSPWDMGLVAIDGLRAGTPVLVPDNPRNGPEVEALTPGLNAMLFTPGEPASLASAISSWFDAALELDSGRYRDARRSALAIWDANAVAAGISAVITR